MFGEIAGKYDLVNRLMTFGQDRVWRQCVVRAAGMSVNGILLDAGAGTGSIALDALKAEETLCIVAADFTLEMMFTGRSKQNGRRIAWTAADALALPFEDACFDAVTSGYLIRNVIDPLQAFKEQARVVKPGGRVVDVPGLVEYAKGLDNVAHAEEGLFICSTDAAALPGRACTRWRPGSHR